MERRFRASRKSFLGNYATSISIIFFMLLIDMIFGLPNIIFFLLLAVVFYFMLEPEFSLIYLRYEIDDEKITQHKGILTKKTGFIPWRLASKVELKQSVLGRIIGYGEIFVSDISEAPGITMKGVSNPKKVLQLIEEKISNVKK